MVYTSENAIKDISEYFNFEERQQEITPSNKIKDWINLKKIKFLTELYSANYGIDTYEIFYEKKKLRDITFEEVAKGIEKLLS